MVAQLSGQLVDIRNGGIFWSKMDTRPLLAQMVKNLPTVQETQVQPLGLEDPL